MKRKFVLSIVLAALVILTAACGSAEINNLDADSTQTVLNSQTDTEENNQINTGEAVTEEAELQSEILPEPEESETESTAEELPEPEEIPEAEFEPETVIETESEAVTQTEPETISEPESLPEPQAESFPFIISFTGDVMIASYMNQTKSGNFNDYANKNDPSYFLEKVRPYFESDDYTFVNLENVLTDRDLKPVEKNSNPAFWFCSRTANTAILTSSSVECVSLANNHTGDYGEEGRKDTIAAVEEAGLIYGNNNKTAYLEKNGYRVAVICHGLWYDGQEDEIIKRIREAEEQSDFQIVFYHGGKEGVHQPEKWRMNASRRLADAGADLVIGNHPHVIQPMENYNGTDILYSMGNFCFGGNNYPENRTIIYRLHLTISPDGELEYKEGEIIPCYVFTGDKNNYQPAPITDETVRQRVFDFLAWERESPK